MKKIMVLSFMCLFMVMGTMQSVQAASFKDMKKTTSLFVEVNYLADQGIISGYPDGTFRPNEPISKKHIAAMLVRTLNLPMTDLKTPNYKDVPTTHPYYKEIAAAYTAGLFSDARYFKPESSISRGFMARLMANAFKLKVLPGTEADIQYRDVPRSAGYYTDILKVSSNNVARGYEDGMFKPNTLITRAHFSAFLTRALTTESFNITPDKNYDYYYTDGKSMYRYEYDREEDNGLTYWKIHNETKSESIPRLGFVQEMNFYGEAYDDWYHYDKIIPFPFVVTQIHDENDIGPVSYGSSWIISTDAVRTVHNVEYRNVIAIESYFPWDHSTRFDYYAKDIGLIQTVDKNGKELYGLVQRKVH
ncbi:S-layer homology domain-containing protein [Lysinibacillus fusiformis]|nr:S-layer homology domain-containing protein [Lysinibacillus fusiformis]